MSWHWEFLFDDPGGADPTYWQWMLSAWGWTLAVAGLAWCVALVAGTAVGLVRTWRGDDRGWAANLAGLWVEVFRNIPLLVQVFLWYHVMPMALPVLRHFSPFLLAVLALGFFTSARIAEQVRSGMASLARGQRAAATALGLSTWQSFRFVLLPQVARIMWPALTSEAMSIVKNSSVAFAVSVSELTLFAMQAQEETSRGIEVYLLVTGLYALTALAVNRLMAALAAKAAWA
jgi:glutamate/aspartate transport system permease protein